MQEGAHHGMIELKIRVCLRECPNYLRVHRMIFIRRVWRPSMVHSECMMQPRGTENKQVSQSTPSSASMKLSRWVPEMNITGRLAVPPGATVLEEPKVSPKKGGK
jgi:hypothetical protein